MNNVIQRQIVVTGSYQPLAPVKTVASVTISCPPTNSGPVWFKAEGANEVLWQPSEWHEFQQIDLSSIQVKGNSGDVVTVVGGTW